MTGIDPGQAGWKVEVYPQPATGRAYLRISGNAEKAVFELVDLNGKLLRRREGLPAGVTGLDLQGMPASVYLWRVNAGGSLRAGKLLVAD